MFFYNFLKLREEADIGFNNFQNSAIDNKRWNI
jgi:hypothetical protein